jgi:ABC-2 type transport system permease protein
MRHALAVCLSDLLKRIRDRTAILAGIVAPLALTALMGSALGHSEGFRMRLVIADLDHTSASAAFIKYVERPSLRGKIFVSITDSAEAAETAIDSHNAECAVILRKGFAESPKTDSSAATEILAAPSENFAMLMTRALLRDFLSRAALPAERSAPTALPLSPGGSLRIVDFFAASMTVLFLNFGILSGVRALQSEVDSRTILRLIASPAQPYTIVAGKFGALLLLGLIQMGAMIAATSLLFGTRWGSPLPVVVLVFTSVLMTIGLTAFLMSLTDNADQGAGLAAIVITLLAIVGGNFLPPQGLPDVFETLTKLTPNGQAFYGFVDLVAAGARGTLGTITEPIVVTTLVGIAGITMAAARSREALRRIS